MAQLARRTAPVFVVLACAGLFGASLGRVELVREDAIRMGGPCGAVHIAQPARPVDEAEAERERRRIAGFTDTLEIDTGDAAPFSRLIARQELYVVGASGSVTGVTVAARRRLAGSQGPKLRAAVAGAGAMVQAGGRRGDALRGIALTDSAAGFAASTATVATAALGATLGAFAGGSDSIAQQVYDLFLQPEDAGGGEEGERFILALYHPLARWAVLGPDASRELRRVLATGAPIDVDDQHWLYVLRHELHHAITPEGVLSSLLDFSEYSWLEEGTASTLAGWPGAVDATALQLGLHTADPDERPFDKRVSDPDGYGEEVRAVRALLTLAGVDPNDPGDLVEAQRLLQRPNARDIPASLATAITRRGKVPARACRGVESAVRGVNGSRARVGDLARALQTQRGAQAPTWR